MGAFVLACLPWWPTDSEGKRVAERASNPINDVKACAVS